MIKMCLIGYWKDEEMSNIKLLIPFIIQRLSCEHRIIRQKIFKYGFNSQKVLEKVHVSRRLKVRPK